MTIRAAATLAAAFSLVGCSAQPPTAVNETEAAKPAQASPEQPVLSASDRDALATAVGALYAPFRQPDDAPAAMAWWQRPVFSATLTAQLARWEDDAPQDALDSPLQEGDGFCQCQDWDPATFTLSDFNIQPISADAAKVLVHVDLGDEEDRLVTILFQREGAAWKVADLTAPAFPNGLAALVADDLSRWTAH